jgi:hypothetical protein
MPEEEIIKRGSSGGTARAAKLSKEQRSKIASEAARARWAKKRGQVEIGCCSDGTATYGDPPAGKSDSPSASEETGPKHCPACLAGQSLEEGEGTHVLATVEHPVALPVAFSDEPTPTAPAPPRKAPKRPTKVIPKEFKSASSYAERRLPKAIQEKADLIVELAKREAEIQELVRVLQAFGGQIPVGIPPVRTPYQPQLPPQYPEYQQAPAPYQPNVQSATPIDIPAAPKRMSMGGAGALDIILQD